MSLQNGQPPRGYTGPAIAIVVGALIIGAAIYASSYEGRTATVTTTATVIRSTTASSAVSTTSPVHIPVPFASTQNASLGLILDLKISTNATGALIINTNATNLLNKMNNVTAADDWLISPGKTGSDPCGGSDSFPIQYAVFQGNYDAGNYSAGSALTLYSTVVPVECVGNGSPPRYYLFLPLGDETSLGEQVFGNYAGTGYWTGSSSSATFNPFPPGFYTVLAQDEWGQIAFVHFTLTVAITGTSILYASEVSADGLQLQVTLNSSSIQSRVAAAVQIELLNTLSHNVSLTLEANQNLSVWNSEDYVCSNSPSNSLLAFALFSGHFSAENISVAGSPLRLAPPVAIPCAIPLSLDSATFLPNSDKTQSFNYDGQDQETTYSYPVTAELDATTSYCISSVQSNTSSTLGSCLATSAIFGYWNPGFGYGWNETYASNDFTYLPPGEYTIVATDAWNQYVYAYITVL